MRWHSNLYGKMGVASRLAVCAVLGISESDFQRREARYWKNMWVNSRNIDLDDGFGGAEDKPRYVTQEELDARKKRIMEFDFTEPKEKKENA